MYVPDKLTDFSHFSAELFITAYEETVGELMRVYLALAVEETSNAGVGVVTGQNETRLGFGAGALAYSGIDGQLVVVGIGRYVVFQRTGTPLHRT